MAEVPVVLVIKDQGNELGERYYEDKYEDSDQSGLGRTGPARHGPSRPYSRRVQREREVKRITDSDLLDYLRVISLG